MTRHNDIMDQLIAIASTPIAAAGYPARPPRIRLELDGVTIGELLMALRDSGLLISNDSGVLMIHRAEEIAP